MIKLILKRSDLLHIATINKQLILLLLLLYHKMHIVVAGNSK